MKLGSKLIFIILGLLLSSCAKDKAQSLSAPISVPPPSSDTSSLGNNINELDTALKKASSQIERIKILINSIPE